MNHLTHIHLLLAAAALSAALFGCKKDPVEINPNFNPETDEVNAAFVMSVSTGSSRATKMGASNVQKNNNFLGINNAKLILYATGKQPTAFMAPPDAPENLPQNHLYDLGPVFTTGAIDAPNNESSSSNRVLQLTLPIGVDAALFYGKANNPTPGKAQGYIDFSHIDVNPSNTWFGAQSIIGGDANVVKYDATGRLMIYAINTILATSIEGTDSYSRNGYTNSAALPGISWKELGHQWEVNHNNGTDNPYGRTGNVTEQVFLAESMGQAYATFTHIRNGEYRAGSSAAVKAMMQSLYSVVKNTLDAKSLNDAELNVQRLAYYVKENVQKFFDTDDWTYLDASVIKTKISNEDWSSEGFSEDSELNNYPYGTFGIPEGAAQLQFDHEHDTFSYIHPNNALVTPGETFEPRKYIYPAELTYYVNSPLWVTAKTDLSYEDYPNGTSNWDKNNTDNDSKWKTGGWSLNKVSSDTRGVAIRDEIKYGVAMLETNVAWFKGATDNSTIEDNREAHTGEEDRSIKLSDTHFQLRGVLIGGVHPRFNWQFIPRALTDDEDGQYLPEPYQSIKRYGVFDGVIYDDSVPSASIPTASPNYTLVYDNYNYSDVFNSGNQNDVYVALEFVNGGEAFWGRDNLIPHDGVFYLGAKLTVAPKELNDPNSTQTITWPSNHQIPPINETTGESKQIPRVFIQGFLTKATFRIGPNSLKYAYYSVPNLASSQMSFGLSVDLSWESGYEYDLEFGANN